MKKSTFLLVQFESELQLWEKLMQLLVLVVRIILHNVIILTFNFWKLLQGLFILLHH